MIQALTRVCVCVWAVSACPFGCLCLSLAPTPHPRSAERRGSSLKRNNIGVGKGMRLRLGNFDGAEGRLGLVFKSREGGGL